MLEIMRDKERSRDWTAIMIDVDPDDLKTCVCEFPALFFVHPDEYRPGNRVAHQGFFRIPGKYRNRDAAYDALAEMMATRH